MGKLQSLTLSPKEVLESYNHIVLTEDEMIEALLWAKRKKELELEKQALLEKEKANRQIASAKWDYDVIRTFMFHRAKEIFKYDWVIDENNSDSFDLMCNYFIGDEDGFLGLAKKMEIENADIKKGILFCGNFGTGKTDLMRLFTKNNRQTYYLRTTKKIAADFSNSDDKKIPAEYLEPFKNAINDASSMFQLISGLCIDEIGAEQVKNNYGNKSNVIGDLIEERYHSGYTGLLLHGTTNLSADELKEFYGERVTSRMRQIFNFIELPGTDRRK